VTKNLRTENIFVYSNLLAIPTWKKGSLSNPSITLLFYACDCVSRWFHYTTSLPGENDAALNGDDAASIVHASVDGVSI
jgi:hypothetical protein